MSAHLALVALVLAADLVRPPISPDPATLAVPDDAQAAARELIRRLGSESFPDRDAAFRELRQMGRLALTGLRAGGADNDPEVRYRCGLLLPAAMEDDFHARLAVFLADADGKFRHDLPGWAEFRALTGNDPLARELFAELLRDAGNRAMLAGVPHGKPELARRVIDRRRVLAARMAGNVAAAPAAGDGEPALADAAGLAFCETLLGEKHAPGDAFGRGRRGSVNMYSVFTRGSVQRGLDRDRFGPAVRKLLVAWLDSRETAHGLSNAVTLASRLDMPEATTYAARLIAAQGASPALKATAAATIARFGDKEAAKLLRPLLADESVLRSAVGFGSEIQVRDVALAMAVQMTGRDPSAFGYEARGGGYYGYFYSGQWFPTAADRAKAFEAWAKLEPDLTPKADGEKK